MDSRVTSRDVQEIVSKLSSDKAKAREEGIKLLNTWLEGEKSILFCKYLSEKTASLKPDEIPHSETWPYMVRVLIQCVTSELLSSKRRLPKLNFAKTLRMVVQRAEDPKISGNNLPLLPVAKLLFNHVFDVLKDVASFQSEYAVILRHLLAVHHYRFHMRQRVYSGLVLLYIGKVQASLDIKSSGLSNPKEDVFRCVLTLHSLLESPPGDFPDDLREDIAMGFVKIFTHIRDEGKISRKLIECINTYLLKDGPNIGGRALEIYDAMQQFVFRCWITTHDRSLKDALILYARLQLSLTRGTDDGGPLLEQLLEVLSKELDHLNISNSTLPRSDTSRDDKCGILTASQHALLELAALAFCRACTGSKASFSEKRARREHMVVQIKDRLVKGKWPWHAALCYLIRKYHTRIRKDLIISWFDCICDSLERIINDANMEHVYDGVLWTLRSLQELSALLQFNALRLDSSPNSSFTINENLQFGKGWDIIWSCLVRCLPTFSNVAYVADAAFTLLSSMIQLDMSSFFTISQDTWDLQLFKCLPTASILRFISCYFSQRVSQGDVRDDLHLRKNLLRSVLAVLNEKEPFTLNERLVVLLPVALYSLSAGCAPLPLYIPEAPDNLWAEDHDYGSQPEYLELSVEVLAKIEFKLGHKVLQPEFCKGVQLPLKLTNVLLRQLETHTVEALKEWENRKMCLRDVFYTCALLCNLIYCSSFTGVQLREDYSFHDKLGHYVIKLMDQASSLVEKTRNDVTSSCVGPDSIFHSRHSVLSSFKCFVCSPLFSNCRNKSDIGLALYTKITQSFERLLKGVAEVFEGCSDYRSDLHPRVDHSDVFDFKVAGGSCPSGGSSSLIVDMELDVHSGSEDVELLPFGGKVPTGLTFSPVNLKMELVLFFSCFFTVLPAMTWDILFDLAGKESNPNVRENLLLSMCRHPYWSSEKNLLGLIMSLNEVIDTQADLKLQSLNALDAICSLVQSLLLLCRDAKHAPSLNFASFDKGLIALGDLVNKIADTDIFDWSSRSKLIDCICNFVLLKPEIGQSMIEKLLLMLRDPDYRVRVTLARQVGALFKTWEGHNELLQDICFNFGAKVVIFSREKIVTAKEVIAAGPQPRVLLETAIVTLMHLALESEKIELEAVFIICAVAAMDPCQRELVGAALDNLSKELCYTSRSKYMEELIGPLLFCWIACGVSLVALVENRKLFVQLMEPSNFMQYCCHWLLPALLLNEDSTNLNWAANVACQPSSMLVKSHFVHIFSVCIALHCSKNAGWEKGSKVLESSILITAEISQDERDKLIKTNMVSIVNFLFSLAAASDDPAPPFFSRNTIKRAIQTVVDGFLEMEDHSRSLGLVDKINIFRPDRVLMFILEIHYKITAATHYRHKCNRLAGIEVLINVLGDRVLISSTFNYLLNVVGQCIGRHALLGQCCRIISTLMMMYKSHPSADITIVLGEQLQFLVSKLVSCCVYSESDGIVSPATSSEIISLLHHIALHPDPSLSEYIKELDSFPDSDLFAEIRRVHEELSEGSSPRNHLVNLAKKSCDLPPRILMPRLKALHKKFFGSEGEEIAKPDLADKHWQSDHDAVNAVWNLVSICRLDAIDSVAALVADFVAKIGIGDPHRVVFDLPGEFTHTHRLTVDNANNLTESVFYMDSGMSEQLLCAVLRLLKKYLMEDSVKIIDLSSQALRGVLSTEMGQRALLSFDLCERSLIEVHSEGVNTEVVQKLVSDLERKFCDETHDVGNSALWTTNDKTFEMWICPVVYALIGFCDDVMLRLCQDIVLVKSEVAELLLPKVMVNIARKRDFNVDLCSLISVQVQEHIFTNSNTLLKSVKVMLDALNALRLCHVFERATTSSASHKREAVKHAKPSTYGSRSRSLSAKQKDDTPSEVPTTLQWPKAYWLPIDYLVAAKSATNCGSYFTALMYVEYWCDEHFKTLTLGSPDFSHVETLAHHIEILISAVTQINEPDSLYGIIQSHKLTSQIVMFEHEGNWTRAFEHYDLLVRSEAMMQKSPQSDTPPSEKFQSQDHEPPFVSGSVVNPKKPLKGLIRSLQKLGCTHVLDVYCQGLASQKSQLPHDLEFAELQYEAAWRAGDWDFSLLNAETSTSLLRQDARACHFNGNLHSCLRALKDGIYNEFDTKLRGAKQELVLCLSNASEESTEYIHSTIVKLQMLQHLGMAWDSRWNMSHRRIASSSEMQQFLTDSVVPASTMDQLSRLNRDWSRMLDQGQLHMDLLEPVIAFRRVLLQILNCEDSQVQHLLDSATTLRKGRRYSQAAASLHEFKSIWTTREEFHNLYWRGRLEEAKLLRAQGQREMAINLAKFISHNVKLDSDASDVFHFLGKWLAESRSSSSKTILEKYLKHAVALADNLQADSPHSVAKQCQMHFHLAHYADALFQSYEERLNSNEWQAAMRLRKLKTKELEALIRRLKSSSKGEQTEYSGKILELQKQLKMDKEEAEKLQEDRDNFLVTALEGYKSCLVIGDKYDVTVVFRLVSLWFGLSGKPIVVNGMLSAIKEVQSYKFIPLAYQIASRMGSKENQGPQNFQFALISLVKKMAIEHPYHTIFQLLALANGDRIKDKQRSKSSFVVDIDKKVAAENLLKEIYSNHGAVIRQMKQMVEIYIKLAELETKREDTNKKITLPREIRGVRELELVPVVTSNFPVDRSCQYPEGSFPHFKGLADSVTVMNGINAPKVVECFGSDGKTYRQLAKSGNDDLRQDAHVRVDVKVVNDRITRSTLQVMEQFFGLVNTFLHSHRDTRRRRLRIRTYKVVPFTPSAGVLEWVNGTIPLGEYLIGSMRNGGAHGRYGVGDWTFLKCRQHMTAESDKRKAFQEVCANFRPVMHYFFLERFSDPADWFEKRLAYTRSVAASSMVAYIVGLGDRHSMNVLIDQGTAEVVHIDLGVAFEQGLMLKTPERVPFRLTRDIIDGMGITGVEGVFRRCCEETLSVMRTNKEALLTIVEVFIHDPLYKWALSPLKALQRQKDIDDDLDSNMEDSDEEEYEGNKDAARALMRVKQKLDGYEESEMRSVHGQVQQLIQDAIDPDRLCHMFPGWGAWL